ncbi:protein-tyrosine phosphatase-like protein [Mucor lusitanicus]|uniref:protein-tyrosine-phosphatase n=1 Tax=Mucor circinelloides f. lusitanicus TaxID=29924 RepID=A0A8H4BI38_MUCCL|nr:protein-tyrosine phosphatase-like protein [Mucor lusitanicus]
MSVTYESPTRYLSDTEPSNNNNNLMYSISSNENDGSPCTSPYNPVHPSKAEQQQQHQQLPSASHLNQEFFNVLQKRQSNFQSSTGPLPQAYRHQHLEDLAPIEGEKMNELMAKYDCHQVLVIDVRSFAFYAKNRIKSAIHISIPSVLLKRPTYTLDKVCESIVFEEAANRLKDWHHATHIIFYDHASYKPSDSGNSATAILLGSKLRKSGYSGQLNYLQGGYNAFSNTYPHRCELTPAINPFFSNIRQNLELSHGPLKERFYVRLPYGSKNDDGIISTNSQHSATSNHHPRFGLAGSSVDAQGNFVLPMWLKTIMKSDTGPKKLAEKYEQLERLEQDRLLTVMKYHSTGLGPITTIQQDQSKTEFPFSITSSMEKGTLNRYDNIWPYEYSRVKLEENDDNYINANYIQFANVKKNITLSPISKSDQEVKLEEKGLLSEASVRTMNRLNVDLTSNRQYISTQGPLPTTFNDFWQMIWNENSSVIVMLTQETEMNKIKCHTYWPTMENVSQAYGSITVTLASESKQAVRNMNDKRERVNDDVDQDECIITRKFTVSCDGAERTLTQLQYTGWTDFGVPDHPIGILTLVHQADVAQSKRNTGPIVVHCSAGCGRSGTFCVIDTMIQRLWQKRDVYTCATNDKIYETVCRFREQRMSMVQTHRQYVFCYEAILWWLLGYGNLPVQSSDASPSAGPTTDMIRQMIATPVSISSRLSASPPSPPPTATFLPPASLFSAPVENSNNDEEASSVGSIVDDFKDL